MTRRPAHWAVGRTFIDGRPQRRLMVVFRTPPCARVRQKKRCYVCGFDHHSIRAGRASLAEQFLGVWALTGRRGIGHLDLLSSGSLLDSRTVPYAGVLELMRHVGRTAVRSVLIEGRVEWCDLKKLKALRKLLGDRLLEYGTGLEAYSGRVRNRILGKDVKLADYKGVLRKVSREGLGICTYLLVGIPKLSVRAALDEAVSSALRVADLYQQHRCRGRIALYPVFIAPNTQLERSYRQGAYRLLKIEHVARVLERLRGRIDIKRWPVFVGLDDEGISQDRWVGFGEPAGRLAVLEEFNYRQEWDLLDKL